MRRLVELEGVADLERRALMKPRLAEASARAETPEIDACTAALFGLTADAAATTPRPAEWDDIERQPVRVQIEAFEREGWDLTDDRRRPLRMFAHFNEVLWLAIRGIAGTLPFAPAAEEAMGAWGASLQAQATRFKRDRR